MFSRLFLYSIIFYHIAAVGSPCLDYSNGKPFEELSEMKKITNFLERDINACSLINSELISKLRSIKNKKNVWPSVERSKMFFAFYDEKTQILYAFSESVNQKLKNGIESLECKQGENIILIKDSDLFFKGQVGILKGQHGLFSHIDKDMLYLLPLSTITTEMLKERDISESKVDVLIDLSLHEQFHFHTVGMAGQQSIPKLKVKKSYFKEYIPKDSPIHNISKTNQNCESNNGTFYKFLDQEFNDWKLYFDGKIDDYKSLAERIVNRREEFSNSKNGTYLESVRDHERSEGTATFFANSHGFFKSTHKLNPLDTKKPKTFEGYPTFSYITGFGLVKLLDSLSPNYEWQKDVINGDSLDLALKKVLSKL